jgi:TRAP-type C4-dicarboxylate transport system permease small subunit
MANGGVEKEGSGSPIGSLEKVSNELARLLYWIAGAAIVLMMLLSCVDILLRLSVTLYHEYKWSFISSLKPLPGTFELVCFLGAVAVAFAIPHTSNEKGHVAVTLLVRLFPQRMQALVGVFTAACSFIFFALISWRSILYANHMRESGEVSLTLQLPFYPFVYGIAFASAVVCLVLLVDLLKDLNRVFVR